jgi:hypothetical protein
VVSLLGIDKSVDCVVKFNKVGGFAALITEVTYSMNSPFKHFSVDAVPTISILSSLKAIANP